MNNDIAITVNNVSKRYFLYENRLARLRHTFFPASLSGVSEKWALRDISFEAHKGESVGIMGRNGSGKSTLLEIIAGTRQPSNGNVSTYGRIAALLQLGSGFNPEFTGRENIFLNGLILGLSRADMESRFDEIAAFADIGDVLEQSVKTYSSGMLIRLAFAVQVALEPDILIIDEALSVGDYFFRQKCYGHIRKLRDSGMTLLYVTHDMNTIANICDRAVYLQEGEMIMNGDPRLAVRAFLGQPADAGKKPKEKDVSAINMDDYSHQSFPEHAQWQRSGPVNPSQGGLLAVSILNTEGEPCETVRIKETIRLLVYFIPDPSSRAHIYIQLKNRFDEILFTSGTHYLNIANDDLVKDQAALADFEIEMSVGGGGYSLSVLMGYPDPPNRLGQIIDKTAPIGPITVEGDYDHDRVPFLGPFGLPVAARLSNVVSKDGSQ